MMNKPGDTTGQRPGSRSQEGRALAHQPNYASVAPRPGIPAGHIVDFDYFRPEAQDGEDVYVALEAACTGCARRDLDAAQRRPLDGEPRRRRPLGPRDP